VGGFGPFASGDAAKVGLAMELVMDPLSTPVETPALTELVEVEEALTEPELTALVEEVCVLKRVEAPLPMTPRVIVLEGNLLLHSWVSVN
jgi:hypothetical protein